MISYLVQEVLKKVLFKPVHLHLRLTIYLLYKRSLPLPVEAAVDKYHIHWIFRSTFA